MDHKRILATIQTNIFPGRALILKLILIYLSIHSSIHSFILLFLFFVLITLYPQFIFFSQYHNKSWLHVSPHPLPSYPIFIWFLWHHLEMDKKAPQYMELAQNLDYTTPEHRTECPESWRDASSSLPQPLWKVD